MDSDVFPSKPPKFREYYPRFDLLRARRETTGGRTICLFKRSGYTVGQLRILADRPGDSIEVEFVISLRHAMHHGVHTLKLVPSETGFDRTREAVLCPLCEKPRFVLCCKDRWGCAQCYGLRLRSQLVDPLARKAEQLDALEQVLRRGRPLGMHNSTYRARAETLRALRKVVASQPRRVVSGQHLYVTEAEWLERRQVPEFWL